MPKRHTNWMTAKVWTPTMSSELAGTPDGCIPLAFFALETRARRERCLAELQKIQTQLNAREDIDRLQAQTKA